MKNNYKKILLSIIALTLSFAGFAQLPDPGDGGGGGGDPAAPINNKLIWLVVAGLFFAYFIFSTRNKKA